MNNVTIYECEKDEPIPFLPVESMEVAVGWDNNGQPVASIMFVLKNGKCIYPGVIHDLSGLAFSINTAADWIDDQEATMSVGT